MKNKIIQEINYEYPKPNFFKTQLIKLFEWILGGRFKDNKVIDKEIKDIIKRYKENTPDYKYYNKY
tara:strand:- start:86 stop:283 length:198 start_codon:yes stop_codon:yes gene_type:complete